MHVDPYPISGPGTVEVKDGALHVEGGQGIPWQVQVGGLLGLIAGVILTVLLLKPIGATLSLVGLMACIVAGSAAGYRFAGNHLRARHQASFAPAQLVEVSADQAEVRITISFRKRWQTRKQCLHFRPEDVAQIPELRAAVEGLLAQKAS